jgi:VWFA-related protein
MRGVVALVALGFVAAATTAASPQDIPRFRGGIDVVQFTVTVLDKDRRPVAGLTAADFEVRVDGQPRPLAAFAAVTLPVETSTALPAAPRIAPDVETNQLPLEGRLVVVVIDRSIPSGQPMRAARAVANAAIDRLGPADLGAVVFTAAGLLKYSQGITADRARLRAAVAQALGGALQEPPLPPGLAGAAASRGAPQPSQPLNRVQLASEELSGECICGICVPDALTELARQLSTPMMRHKSILFVGSDLAIASTDPGGYCAAYIYPRRERLSRALDGANVTFHAVDPRLLEGLGHTAETDQTNVRAEQTANLFRQSSLAVLPDYTGGRVVLNTNTPADRIGEIFDESRSYYVLAIARDPAVAGADTRRQIAITVKRNDAAVRARNLYFAADGTAKTKTAPNAAAAALGELLPKADFPLQMNLLPAFAEDGSAEVRVLLSIASAVAGKLDVLIASFDHMFRPAGSSLKQRLDVPVAAVAGSAAFQWSSVLKPPPGNYEVRAAVVTEDGTRAASITGYVEVPDVRKTGLALSGVVVKSAGRPTLQRVFAAGEPVPLAFQLARADEAKTNVTMRYLLTDALGQTLASVAVPRATTVRNGIEDYDLTARMPGQPGRYVAAIEASDGRHTQRREVLLTVR